MKTKKLSKIFICTTVFILILSVFLIKLSPNGISATSDKLALNEATQQTSNPLIQDEAAKNTSIKTIINNLGITNSFGNHPETEHNFTWHTSDSIKTGAIEYCMKDKFNGFDKNNIIRVPARHYETKTDLDTRMIYKVELSSLLPGTEYVYRVEVGSDSVSQQGTFKTADSNLNKFTFINITDTQGGSAKDYAIWKNTLDKALDKFPNAQFLIHTGDMVDDGQKIKQWELFTDAVKDEFMNLPIVPTVGNHEALNGNHTNVDMKNFTNTFDLPQESNTGAPLGTAYSFDYGNAHIAVLNTQCGSDNLKKQADWLSYDMAKTNKTWKIVALHRGPYGATYDSTDIRNAWTPIFDKLGIDLVLAGHDHNYVRSYPMKNNTKAANGTVYMVSNSGGVKLYPAKSRWWQAVDFQPKTQMYIAITVDNNKMYIEAYDVEGKLRDSTTLEKKLFKPISEFPVTDTPVISLVGTANPTASKILVNGISVSFDAYNINGNNYFKLRDPAKVVSGTNKQFEVSWDGEKRAINLVSGKSYTVVGGELVKGDGSAKPYTLSTSKIYKDTSEVKLTAYTINGNNYFKLRDVAALFDIGVTWEGTTGTIGIDTNISYVAP